MILPADKHEPARRTRPNRHWVQSPPSRWIWIGCGLAVLLIDFASGPFVQLAILFLVPSL